VSELVGWGGASRMGGGLRRKYGKITPHFPTNCKIAKKTPTPDAACPLHTTTPESAPPNPPTNQPKRRAELDERCRFFLAADDIWEAEGLEVEAQGVEDEVARAKAQFSDQQLGEFSEEGYR
jgi:hypothetical protein